MDFDATTQRRRPNWIRYHEQSRIYTDSISDESTTEDSGPSAPPAHSEDLIGPLITFPIGKSGPVLSHRTPPRIGVGQIWGEIYDAIDGMEWNEMG